MPRVAQQEIISRLIATPRAAIEWIYERPRRMEVFPRFLELANSAVDGNPIKGKRLAQIATRLARGIGSAEMVHSLDCLANAQRALGEYEKSRKTLDVAEKLADGDKALLCLIERRRAHLWGTQGEHERESQHIERSISYAEESGDEDNLGRSLVFRAACLFSYESYDESKRCAEAAMSKLSPWSSPFRRSAQHILCLIIARSGSVSDVRQTLAEMPTYYAAIKGHYGQAMTVERAKLNWVEALLVARLGANGRAAELLERARRVFLKLGMPQEIAALTADLVILEHEDRDRVRRRVRTIGRLSAGDGIVFPPEIEEGLRTIWESTRAAGIREPITPEERSAQARKILTAALDLRSLFDGDESIPVNLLPIAQGGVPEPEPPDLPPIGF